MRISTILVPVDGSTHSDHAAMYAADMAKTMDASIVLLHVRRPVPPELGEPNLSHLLGLLESDAEAVIKPYENMLDEAGVKFQTLVVGGRVAEVIADTVRAEKADLVIMGSKGKTEFEGLIVGSVTHAVLHMAPSPVLVVK